MPHAAPYLVALVGGLAVMIGNARAEPFPPQRLKLVLVPAREACTAPNTTVSDAYPATGAPACSPPVRSDPVCGFGPNGAGEIQVTITKRRLLVAVRLEGLDEGCEGERLVLETGGHATTSACSVGAECTVTDDESSVLLPTRPCTVAEGRCITGGTMPATDLPADSIELALHDIRIERVRAGLPSVRTFEAGIRMPRGLR